MQANLGMLSGYDPTAKIEVTFMAEMSGDRGAKILEDALISHMPTATRDVPVGDVIRAVM